MKNSIFLVAVFTFINCSVAYSQLEVKFYTGAMDLFGVAFEFDVDEKTGFEIGGSFNSKKDKYYVNSDIRLDMKTKDFFVNCKIKKYKDLGSKVRFTYGAYLRYWQYAEVADDMDTWSSSQLEYAKDNEVWLSSREHKFSIGALAGFKGKIFKSFIWEVNNGVGFSPPFLFTYNRKTTKREETGEVGADNEQYGVGILNHLSLLGHISIGYQF